MDDSKLDELCLKLVKVFMDFYYGPEDSEVLMDLLPDGGVTEEENGQDCQEDCQIHRNDLVPEEELCYDQGDAQKCTGLPEMIQQQKNMENFVLKRDKNFEPGGEVKVEMFELKVDDFFIVLNGNYMQWGLEVYMDTVEVYYINMYYYLYHVYGKEILNIQMMYRKMGKLQWYILWNDTKGQLLDGILQFDTKD